MAKKTWESRNIDVDVIQEKIESLERQILAFELQLKYEQKRLVFRDIYLSWYEGRLTLADILQAMIDNSLCQRIGPWKKDEEEAEVDVKLV